MQFFEAIFFLPLSTTSSVDRFDDFVLHSTTFRSFSTHWYHPKRLIFSLNEHRDTKVEVHNPTYPRSMQDETECPRLRQVYVCFRSSFDEFSEINFIYVRVAKKTYISAPFEINNDMTLEPPSRQAT